MKPSSRPSRALINNPASCNAQVGNVPYCLAWCMVDGLETEIYATNAQKCITYRILDLDSRCSPSVFLLPQPITLFGGRSDQTIRSSLKSGLPLIIIRNMADVP